MKLFDADPSLRWLFCMTHPDDEISICAWIRRLTTAGAHVSICWTHSTPVREAEAREGAKHLGVPDEALHFLYSPDRDTCEHLAQLVPEMQKVIDSVKPDRIVCGAFEQGHLDHDSTNWIIHQSWDGPVLEVPFYHTYHTRFQRLNEFADPGGEEVLVLTQAEERFKRDFAKRFPSQNIWSVLLWNEIWHFVRLKPARLSRRERMRLQTHRDFRVPNLPPALRAKVERTEAWQRWLEAVDQAETAHSR